MRTKEKIEERIEELKVEIIELNNCFYGRDYSGYLEDEIKFLEELLKCLYCD